MVHGQRVTRVRRPFSTFRSARPHERLLCRVCHARAAFASFAAVATTISILPDTLADQIAAGEVVERPASVVKELIENAIDAGATRISVEIEEGGLQLIRVSDDGYGMSREDSALSVQRHATSKLRTGDDLFAIRSFGFRGEALPSIASVARFALSTRMKSDLIGTNLRIEGGGPAAIAEIGCAPGTQIEVRELFYNVPARLKFLKSKPTESGHVAQACLRAALAVPALALTLKRDARSGHDFLAHQTFFDRVASAFPGESLRAYEATCEGATLRAALSAPERARSGAAHLHLFVNRRPVRDITLARCVAFAYGSVLPPGRFPVGAVYLELDPADVDVNVHPQKLEVRFARGRAVLDAITRALAQRLGTSAFSGPAARSQQFWQQRLAAQPWGAAPAATGAAPAPEPDAWGLAAASDSARPNDVTLSEALDWRNGSTQAEPWTRADRVEEEVAPLPDLHRPRGFFSGLRVLGQARRTFLVCEGEQGLVILDQHAADERVRFDQLRRSYAAREVRTQALLFPERVECTELEATRIEQHQDELAALGLECSRLGPTTAAVCAVPVLLARASPVRLLRDVLAELSRSGERAFADALDMALATMACHASIRAGDALSPEECSALLQSLDAVVDFQRHCPHGRPILCTLPFGDLEHRLGR
jgi:DNA mismatch repair protein MutL